MRILACVVVSLTVACTIRPEERVVAVLAGACPTGADPKDVAARDACARALGDSAELDVLFGDVVLWGGQAAGSTLDSALEVANVTELEPRVWRRLYLSTFTFSAAYRVEDHPPYRVVIVPVQFRNALPNGEYPYPFWHSPEKWLSYQQATEVALFFREGKLVGGLRGTRHDTTRPLSERTWDGMWRWDEGRQPRVALYAYAFSAENEAIPALDEAYRALAEQARTSGCEACHSPNNPEKMRRLEILNYPAQALAARRSLVSILAHDDMPPPSGLMDERARIELFDRARAFVVAADAAMAREAELTGALRE